MAKRIVSSDADIISTSDDTFLLIWIREKCWNQREKSITVLVTDCWISLFYRRNEGVPLIRLYADDMLCMCGCRLDGGNMDQSSDRSLICLTIEVGRIDPFKPLGERAFGLKKFPATCLVLINNNTGKRDDGSRETTVSLRRTVNCTMYGEYYKPWKPTVRPEDANAFRLLGHPGLNKLSSTECTGDKFMFVADIATPRFRRDAIQLRVR